MLNQQHHNKIINATDFNPGDINPEEDAVDENEAICDELARHYAQHGLKDPGGYFDSDVEEVQRILGQCYGIRGANSPREVGSTKSAHWPFMSIFMDAKAANVMKQSQDSESIEESSGPEELEDEVFLGYFATGDNGNERPIPDWFECQLSATTGLTS